MKKALGVSLVAIALMTGAAATASAETTITTDRVRVTVGDSGNVQIRTAGASTVTEGLTPVESLRPSANVNRLLGCYQQSQRQQDYRTISNTGDRVVSQSQTRVTVCP